MRGQFDNFSIQRITLASMIAVKWKQYTNTHTRCQHTQSFVVTSAERYEGDGYCFNSFEIAPIDRPRSIRPLLIHFFVVKYINSNIFKKNCRFLVVTTFCIYFETYEITLGDLIKSLLMRWYSLMGLHCHWCFNCSSEIVLEIKIICFLIRLFIIRLNTWRASSLWPYRLKRDVSCLTESLTVRIKISEFIFSRIYSSSKLTHF